MKIVIESVPHICQRYDTVGDWWQDPDGTWQVRVSELRPAARYSTFLFLVAFHELIEMSLCLHRGITQEAVDSFDIGWKPQIWGPQEPGDDMSAPYYEQHQIACGFERMMAAHLGVQWSEYESEYERVSGGGSNGDED